MKANKPLIIAVNKWDALTKETGTFEEYRNRVIYNLYRAADFPIISVSAKNKTRIHNLMKKAIEVQEKAKKRIGTPELNRILENIQKRRLTPLLGERLKIYYGTQVDTVPPRFKFFVNNPDLFRKDVTRFLQKFLQKELDIKGVPVMISVEGRKTDGKKSPKKERKQDRKNN